VLQSNVGADDGEAGALTEVEGLEERSVVGSKGWLDDWPDHGGHGNLDRGFWPSGRRSWELFRLGSSHHFLGQPDLEEFQGCGGFGTVAFQRLFSGRLEHHLQRRLPNLQNE